MGVNLSREQLQSLIKEAVAEATSGPNLYTCKNCGFGTEDVDHYIDHKTGELGSQVESLSEKIKELVEEEKSTFDPEDEVCVGGICKIIEERYDVRKKGEIEEKEEGIYDGLFGGSLDKPEE